MLKLDDPTSLSLLYHLNSEPWLNNEAYESAGRQERLREGQDDARTVALPTPEESPLSSLFARRHSCRAFAAEGMALATAGALVAAAQGVVELREIGGGSTVVRRAAPSAGGLYPLELYAFARRVEELPDGIYRYDAFGHVLEPVGDAEWPTRLAGALYAWPFVENANLVLALAATFLRTQKKYGPRGYRYMLLEAGHAVQNVCLRATELDLATLCIGGFVDSRVNALLGLSPAEAGVLYMVAAGNEQR